MNKLEIECENIINDTERKLNEKISKDITIKWERKCPQCNSIVYYNNKHNRNTAVKENRICNRCRGLNSRINRSGGFVNVNGEIRWIRNCPKCNNIIYHKDRLFRNNSESKKHLCMECQRELHSKVMKGRKQSDDDKRKKRISRISYIIQKNGGIRPMCSIRACKYLDQLNKEKEYNFQHALNGGEYHIKKLGYFVDGYDKEKNVVIEYDEFHHNTPRRKEKDVIRMNEIKSFLGCRFLRYNEKTGELKEY